jgi:GntR family transcriptional repressor for pyruvate dehydrogenase complex
MARRAFQATTLSRRDASGQIARQLRTAITTGVWEPGERLPSENELGETFDVSRATAREALKLLSATGLVTFQRGASGGSFVAVPDADDVAKQLSEAIQLWYRVGNISVHDVDEARWELERICVKMAAMRRTDTDIEAIRGPVEAARDFSLPMTEWLDFDLEFHSAITAAARNKILELAMTAVHLSRPATNDMFVDLLGRQDVWQQHDRIATAIANGDPDAAEQALSAHVTYLGQVRDRALADLQVDDVVISDLPRVNPLKARRLSAANDA